MALLGVVTTKKDLHGPNKNSKQGLHGAPACTTALAEELLVDIGKPLAIPVTQKVPAVDLSAGVLVGGLLEGNTISMETNRDTSSRRHTMGGTEHTLVCLQVLVLPGIHIGQLLHSGSASLNDVFHHLMWQQDWVLNMLDLVVLGVCDGNGDQVRQRCSATFMYKSPEVPGTVLLCFPRVPNPSNTLAPAAMDTAASSWAFVAEALLVKNLVAKRVAQELDSKFLTCTRAPKAGLDLLR